ncbi:MAG: hypothetical protein IRZ08_12850, partial [Frankia sp.]|nr:hypothetical protein [Frankia sp.]
MTERPDHGARVGTGSSRQPTPAKSHPSTELEPLLERLDVPDQQAGQRSSRRRPGGRRAEPARGGQPRPQAASGESGGGQKDDGPSALYRNGLALVLSSGLSATLGAGYWVLAAHNTPRAALGEATALVSAMMALSMLGQLNLGSALTAFLPMAGRRRVQLATISYLTTIGLSGLLGLGFGLLAPRLSDSFGSLASLPAGLLFAVSVIAWSLFSLQDSVLTGARRATWVPLENTAYNVVKVAMLALLGGGSVAMLISSWVVPAAIALIPVGYLLFRHVLPSDEPPAPGSDNRSFWRFTAAESVSMVFSQISVTVLPVLVVAVVGPEAGAAFGLAWMITTALDQLVIGMGSSLLVEGSRPGADVRGMHRAVRRRTLTGLAAIILVAEAGAPLLLRLFGSTYADDALTIFRLLVLACLPRALHVLAMFAAAAERRIGWVMRWQFILAVITPGGALVLGNLLGLTGIGLAWLGAQVVVALCILAGEAARPAPARPVPVPEQAPVPAGEPARAKPGSGVFVGGDTTIVITRPRPQATPALAAHSNLLDADLTRFIPRDMTMVISRRPPPPPPPPAPQAG